MTREGQRAKSEVARAIYEQADRIVSVARAIHADPEIAFSEQRASARLVDLLSDSGFEIRTGAGALATAFVASRGRGELHVGLCAEYDALDGGIGHGSGRHLVAGAAAGAAIGLAPFADDAGLTVSVLGTPGAGLLDLGDAPAGHTRPGKAALLEEGLFDDVHAALALFPSGSFTGFAQTCARSRSRASLTRGAGSLELELRCLEDELLRDAAAHGARYASCRFRSAAGGAEITGDIQVSAATVHEADAATASTTRALARIARRSRMELRVTEFETIRQVRSDATLRRAFVRSAAALGFIADPSVPEPVFSSDLGIVSVRRPAIAPMFAIRGAAALGTREFAALADTEDAYRSMVHGAVALAWTAYDVAVQQDARSRLLGTPPFVPFEVRRP